jgi:hypothetical protein
VSTAVVFCPAQHGDVLASLNEFPWLKGMNVVCLRKGLKKIGHLLGGSAPSGVRQSRRSDTLPIDFVSDQLHKGRNIMSAESCVGLLNNINAAPMASPRD